MSPDNQEKIRERILEAAKALKGKLPDHPKHPQGRNAYAHIPKVIKDAAGANFWQFWVPPSHDQSRDTS